MKNKPSLKAVISLTVICLATAIILACVNFVTAPMIERAEKQKEQDALRKVLPEGEAFEPLKAEELSLDKRITAAYRETGGGGYVFKVTLSGYKSGMTVLCGIGADGRVDGAVCLSSSETLEAEKTYGQRFTDLSSEEVMKVDTVSGATKTTAAYREAVRISLEAFEELAKEGRK